MRNEGSSSNGKFQDGDMKDLVEAGGTELATTWWVLLKRERKETSSQKEAPSGRTVNHSAQHVCSVNDPELFHDVRNRA